MSEQLRLVKLGLIMEKKEELAATETKINRCVNDVETWSYPKLGIEDIDVDKTIQAAQELKNLKAQWTRLRADIAQLEREVGIGQRG